MSGPQDAGKYQVNNKTVQGQVIGDNPIVHQHFYATQDKATLSTKPQRVWNIPYLRNDYFTGREEILTQLHTRFKADNATALSQRHAMSGLGGVGKTQIAVEYAYRYDKDYQAVLWARAESHGALTSSFVEIATLLDLPQKDEQDQTITVQAVKHWLQDNNGWLLILDNADEPKIVYEFLPTKFDGHILLTTRAQALGRLAQRIEVDTFTPELGALFLLRRASIITADGTLEQATQQDREVALQISKKLGGLPLALDQAGAYIEETACSLSDYLNLYHTRRAEMLKERGGLVDDHPDSVAMTWSLSFQRVQEKNAAAADLLRLCAFLAPDAIPEEIITAGAEHLGPLLQATANDPITLNKVIAALSAYSLIHRDATEKTLSIHRLVQAVLRDAMPKDETKLWTERTVRAVNAAFPETELAQWSAYERYLPHARACVRDVEQCNITLLDAASLLHRGGWYLDNRTQYSEAKLLCQRALAIREQQLGPKHPDTASSFNNLAELYRAHGKYEKAEPRLRQALAIFEQSLGLQHPNTVICRCNLASLYKSQREYKQAEDLYNSAISICEDALAISPHNLAWSYCIQGKDQLALPPYKHAVLYNPIAFYPQDKDLVAEPLCKQAIWKKVLAITLNNLAGLHYIQGEYELAESLCQRAISICKTVLGPEHPKIATDFDNLALCQQAQGKYEEAESSYKSAIAIYEKTLGRQHPHTQSARQNYASLLRAMGRDEEAKQIEEKQ